MCIVPVRKRRDKVMRACKPGSQHDILPGSARPAVNDVIHHAAGKKIDILLHHADGPAQAFKLQAFHILPVDQDAAAAHVIKAGDQVAHGGLARAAWAYQRYILPGRHGEVDMA